MEVEIEIARLEIDIPFKHLTLAHAVEIRVQTSTIKFIGLFTNRLAVRDLQVTIPPTIIVFRHATF